MTDRRRSYGKADTGEWIEATGVVIRLLHDDSAPNGHQRFVVALANGQTLLIAHNLEVAPQVPLGLGDRVRFRGIFEWNEHGGLVHWTHDDPMGVEPGGFVAYRGKTYR